MGKSGELLRAGKDQVKRVFTEEELRRHDKAIIAEYVKSRERIFKDSERQMEADFDKYAHRRWTDHSVTVISYSMALACRVLIEQFHWKSRRDTPGNLEPRVQKFANAMLSEYDKLELTDEKRLRAYAEETEELYGIGFHFEGEVGWE